MDNRFQVGQIVIPKADKFSFLDESGRKYLVVTHEGNTQRFEVPDDDKHEMALHFAEELRELYESRTAQASQYALFKKIILWLKPEWKKLSDDEILWAARGSDSDSDSEEEKKKDKTTVVTDYTNRALKRAGVDDFKRYVKNLINYKKLIGDAYIRGEKKGQSKDLKEQLAGQSKDFLYSSSSFQYLSSEEQKIARAELALLQSALKIESLPDGKLRITKLVSSDSSAQEVVTTQTRFAFATYRGIHYLRDRWNRQSWEAHRQYDETKRFYPSEAVWKTMDKLPPEAKPLFYTQFKKFKEKIEDKKSDFDPSLNHNATLLNNQIVNHLRGSWYVAMKVNDKYKFFHNLSYAFNYIYSNGIVRYLKFVEQLRISYPAYFGRIFPNPHNFLVSVSDLPYHASRYSYGHVKKPYDDWALLPKWFQGGRAFHPYVGKLVAGIHPLSDMIDIDAPNHLQVLRLQNEIGLGIDISHELEISFPSFIPQNRIFYQRGIKYPSFNSKYKPHYAEKYGLPEDLYNLFSQVFTKVEKGIIKEEDLLFLLTEWLCRYHTARTYIQVEAEAKERKVAIIYRDAVNKFSDKPPVAGKMSKKPEKEKFLSTPERKDIGKSAFQIFNQNPSSIHFKHYSINGVYDKTTELLLLDEQAIQAVCKGVEFRNKLDSPGVTLSGKSSPKTPPEVKESKSSVYASPELDVRSKPHSLRSLSDAFSQISIDKPKDKNDQSSALPQKESKSAFYQELLKAFYAWGQSSEIQASQQSLVENQSAENLVKQAKEFGYECKDVKPDGNCFFHAALDQLIRSSSNYSGYTHEKLRELAVDHILNNAAKYQGFIDGNFDTFIAKIMQRGEWADNVIIYALSRALKVTIAIVRSDGADPRILKQSNATAVIYLGYEVGRHYQSLIFHSDWVATRNLQEYITQAPSDNFLEEKNVPAGEPVLPLPSIGLVIAQRQQDNLLALVEQPVAPAKNSSSNALGLNNGKNLPYHPKDKVGFGI